MAGPSDTLRSPWPPLPYAHERKKLTDERNSRRKLNGEDAAAAAKSKVDLYGRHNQIPWRAVIISSLNVAKKFWQRLMGGEADAAAAAVEGG
jgi:hypothetical protein